MAVSRMMTNNFLKFIQTNKVHDNVKEKVLSISFNDCLAATVSYEKNGDIYDLIHTNIPEEFQGKGLGTAFSERIFEHLVENNKKMKLTCEFLDHCYSKNVDKYKHFVVK